MDYSKNSPFFTKSILSAVALLLFLTSTLIVFKGRERQLFDAKIVELKASLPEFLAERLKKEKKESRLRQVNIVSVDRKGSGIVNVAYSLLFDDLVSGRLTPSSVEATAVLKNENEIWKVVKITTKKETVDFTN